MDVTATQVVSGRPGRVRRWLAGDGAPPSLRAQLVLLTSAVLLGAVLSALLFVGLWRHTAADRERARAAQLTDRQQLLSTKRKLDTVAAELANEQAALAKTRAGHAAATTELTQLRQLHRSVANSLSAQLHAVTGTTGALAHDASTLVSEIAALRAYLTSAAPTGVDSGFLDAQVRYLVASTSRSNAAVSRLEQQTQAAQATAAKLGKPAP